MLFGIFARAGLALLAIIILWLAISHRMGKGLACVVSPGSLAVNLGDSTAANPSAL